MADHDGIGQLRDIRGKRRRVPVAHAGVQAEPLGIVTEGPLQHAFGRNAPVFSVEQSACLGAERRLVHHDRTRAVHNLLRAERVDEGSHATPPTGG